MFSIILLNNVSLYNPILNPVYFTDDAKLYLMKLEFKRNIKNQVEV